MAQEPFEEYLQLAALFKDGDISTASKEELEHYAVMLSRPNAYSFIGYGSFPQMCDTVRTLIMVRMSEEANKEATRISQIALAVAMAAFGGTLIQVFLALWPCK